MNLNNSKFAFCKLAKILKTHHVKGDVACSLMLGASPFLLKSLNLYLVPPIDEQTRYLKIDSVKDFTNDSAILHFEGIDHISKASALCDHYLLVKKNDLGPDFDFSKVDVSFDETFLIDFLVTDEKYGNLGFVKEIIFTPANSVLVVQSSPNKEVLIPYIEDCIISIDDDKRIIHTTIMEGLL